MIVMAGKMPSIAPVRSSPIRARTIDITVVPLASNQTKIAVRDERPCPSPRIVDEAEISSLSAATGRCRSMVSSPQKIDHGKHQYPDHIDHVPERRSGFDI